jgi:hypothetical protein
MDKHSSLLRKSVNDDCKKFYSTEPRCQHYKTFFPRHWLGELKCLFSGRLISFRTVKKTLQLTICTTCETLSASSTFRQSKLECLLLVSLLSQDKYKVGVVSNGTSYKNYLREYSHSHSIITRHVV